MVVLMKLLWDLNAMWLVRIRFVFFGNFYVFRFRYVKITSVYFVKVKLAILIHSLEIDSGCTTGELQGDATGMWLCLLGTLICSVSDKQ